MTLRFLITSFQHSVVRLAVAATLLVPLAAGPQQAAAQPVSFGSADDPREALQRVWWRRETTLDMMGGLSLIAAQWRAAGGLDLNTVTRSLTARLSGTLRGGVYGEYEPDLDELYDVLRLLEFARYNPPPRSPLYLRAGLIQRMRLGTGHVVNFFNSAVAVDERTVGVEMMRTFPAGEVAAFTDNVLVNGVTGGRIAARPLYRSPNLRFRTLTLGFNYVTDLHTRTSGVDALTAYNLDASFALFSSGELYLSPFVSYAWYTHYGSGLGFGADVASDNFIDLARFQLRLALFYNGRQFIPGYVGSFYQVSNPRARICNSDRFFERAACSSLEGVPLHSALGGNDLLTELRILVFERFEFWYYFRRHYGSQSQSEYHLRIFARATNRLRIDIGIDRGGLRGILSLLNDFGDQTALTFATDYRVTGALWLYMRARYSFEQILEGADGTAYYLVQRRFEPLSGIRIVL